jgi:hypothetical protein
MEVSWRGDGLALYVCAQCGESHIEVEPIIRDVKVSAEPEADPEPDEEP